MREYHDPARHPTIEGSRNRDAVREFFKTHPGCTSRECADEIGVALVTVTRHLRVIRKEWK